MLNLITVFERILSPNEMLNWLKRELGLDTLSGPSPEA